MDVIEIYRRCNAAFAVRVHAVAGRWREPTPLPGWSAHDLVHHPVSYTHLTLPTNSRV